MTKAQAKRKIKSHVRNNSRAFEVTPRSVLLWWHLLNKAIFDDALSPPRRLEIRNFRDCSGWCQGCAPERKNSDDVIMGIQRSQDNRAEFIHCLAHEMVHQWEWVELKAMSHGKPFYEWSDRVEEITGAPLQERVPSL